jgi:hypothetical protein
MREPCPTERPALGLPESIEQGRLHHEAGHDRPLRAADLDDSIRLRPWDVLHTPARAISLARRRAARGLAERWGSRKYSLALNGSATSVMWLSTEGRDHSRLLQGAPVGGTRHRIRAGRHRTTSQPRYPDHAVSIVPSDTVLRDGWALNNKDKGPTVGYRYRPQYFAEIWKPGNRHGAPLVVSRGNHGTVATSYSQLVSDCRQLLSQPSAVTTCDHRSVEGASAAHPTDHAHGRSLGRIWGVRVAPGSTWGESTA